MTLFAMTALIVLVSHMAFPLLPSFFYQTIALLLMGTIGLYFYLVDVKRQKTEYFVPLYIATMFVKILAYGAYILFVVWDDPSQASNNALLFMVTYFLFTAAEVLFLYRKVNG